MRSCCDSIVETFCHDANAFLDYYVDWTSLVTADDVLMSVEIVDVTPGLTVENSAIVGKMHQFWVSGGAVGQQYIVTSRVETAAGRRADGLVVFNIV